jgi:hypothetical protein
MDDVVPFFPFYSLGGRALTASITAADPIKGSRKKREMRRR